MDDSFFIEYLRQKQYPTDLEKDILEKQLAALAASVHPVQTDFAEFKFFAVGTEVSDIIKREG